MCLLNLLAWKASWAHRTGENGKKDNYKIKKVGPNVERLCSLLAQFRCGILPLRIETGRYVGEKPNERRLRKICDSQQIEDETHFLLHCPFYSVLRNTLFSSVEHADLDQLSDTNKTIVLMNNSPRQTAKYLVGAYEKRKTFLYTRN